MRNILPIVLTAILVLFAGEPATAGTCDNHPTDSTAVYVATFEASVHLSDEFGLTVSSTSRMLSDICVWLTGDGRTDYVINTTSIRFEGDCDSLGTIPTSALFAVLAREAVAEGALIGYSECNETTMMVETARVFSSTCVQRTGGDTATQFIACNADSYCWRSYELSCNGPFNDPVVTELLGNNGSCDGGSMPGCEATCGGNTYPMNGGQELR